MSATTDPDKILDGRETATVLREALLLVDYPDYVIASALKGDGLSKVHSLIGPHDSTREAVAAIITDLIAESITASISATPANATPTHSGFPLPLKRRIFGKRNQPLPQEPVFTDAVPLAFEEAPVAAYLMRAEAVTRMWRQGRIDSTVAVDLLTVAARGYDQRA